MSADRRKFLETATAAAAATTIYFGTPEEVGLVVPGDVMEGHIDGLYEIRVQVV